MFIISTYIEGQPPENARWFYKWLQEGVDDFRVPKTLLKGVRYTVFGLGNSLYQEHYNEVGNEKVYAGDEISKNCQWSFWPLMSYFLGPSQSFKGPDFLFSLMGLITVLLSACRPAKC